VPAYGDVTVAPAAVADLDGYPEVEDPVVDLVVTLAGPWAAATGWTP
jgi:hypothetical protein